MPFSWENTQKQYAKKLLYRYGRLAKINPDFQVRHPELTREAELGNTQVELKKFVDLEVKKKLKYGRVPRPSVIIKRMNRVV